MYGGYQRVVRACRRRMFDARRLIRELQQFPDRVTQQFDVDFVERVTRSRTGNDAMHTFCDLWTERTNETIVWTVQAAERFDHNLANFIANQIWDVILDQNNAEPMADLAKGEMLQYLADERNKCPTFRNLQITRPLTQVNQGLSNINPDQSIANLPREALFSHQSSGNNNDNQPGVLQSNLHNRMIHDLGSLVQPSDANGQQAVPPPVQHQQRQNQQQPHPSEPMEDARVNTRGEFLQRYIEFERLGQGAQGTATRARRRIDNEIVVLKEIRLHEMHNDGAQTRARREPKLLTKLKHPNIVQIFDVYPLGQDLLFLEMEFCAGGDLSKKIAAYKSEKRQFDEATEVKLWMKQLAMATDYLHKNGIVHRDIKPQNILFKDEGCTTTKMIDFGLAKHTGPDHTTTATTETQGILLGTLLYMAPEVMSPENEQEANDYKRDVWALGVVLYDLAMLEVPFTVPSNSGDKVIQLYFAIKRGNMKPITNRTAELVDVVSLMLKKFDERPTMEQLLQHEWFQQ